ncbi:MAG TPA: heparan-alpha-glucosaminide N-acetyltransferase domain-containing protein, partial [Actinomycetospora sp.]|nr:heparan-alpha-glucosaminide N-acetyltransferase domain-containing protein [Actinomycetospora sp.]
MSATATDLEAPTTRLPVAGSASDPPAADAPDPPGRLPGVDAARGVALLGMMAVHALWVVDDRGAPTAVGMVASGNAAALFAVLAGVGVAFLTGRARVSGAAAARCAAGGRVARAAVVALRGLALGLAVDAGIAAVILPFYAVLFVLAVPLVLLPTPVLAGGAVAGAAGLPFLSHLLRAGLPPSPGENPSLAWIGNDPAGLVRELLLTGP